jgi:hypothetical protein
MLSIQPRLALSNKVNLSSNKTSRKRAITRQFSKIKDKFLLNNKKMEIFSKIPILSLKINFYSCYLALLRLILMTLANRDLTSQMRLDKVNWKSCIGWSKTLELKNKTTATIHSKCLSTPKIQTKNLLMPVTKLSSCLLTIIISRNRAIHLA